MKDGKVLMSTSCVFVAGAVAKEEHSDLYPAIVQAVNESEAFKASMPRTEEFRAALRKASEEPHLLPFPWEPVMRDLACILLSHDSSQNFVFCPLGNVNLHAGFLESSSHWRGERYWFEETYTEHSDLCVPTQMVLEDSERRLIRGFDNSNLSARFDIGNNQSLLVFDGLPDEMPFQIEQMSNSILLVEKDDPSQRQVLGSGRLHKMLNTGKNSASVVFDSSDVLMLIAARERGALCCIEFQGGSTNPANGLSPISYGDPRIFLPVPGFDEESAKESGVWTSDLNFCGDTNTVDIPLEVAMAIHRRHPWISSVDLSDCLALNMLLRSFD